MLIADDVSKLNATSIFKILYPKSVEECVWIVNYARKHSLTIIPRGAAHSMGGQTIPVGGIIVDMKKMNKIINLDTEQFVLTLEPGILWSDVIRYLDPLGLSLVTLQSYSSFSVGGTLAVNAHGITSDNTVADSVVAVEIVDANGRVVVCTRHANPELFSLVLGGYGLFGIITKVTIKIAPNVHLIPYILDLDVDNFVTTYQKVLNDSNVSRKVRKS